MVNFIKKILVSKINKVIKNNFDQQKENIEKTLFFLAKQNSLNNLKLKILEDLSQIEFKVYSQWGEDGIIDWLVNNINDIPNTFIEFGCETYEEANTRYLLENKNWSGLIIDNNKENIRAIKSSNFIWKYDLHFINETITRENINNIISKNFKFKHIGVLSIDIDGNDYWVWKNINVIKPCIVICEYNSTFGDINSFTIPYDKKFNRSQKHYSNLYFGASIKALIDLGKSKNYKFLGTNSNGCNAFFIRTDLADIILKKIKNISIYPGKFRESRDQNNNLNFLNSNEKLEEINHLKVYDLNNEKYFKIKELKKICSEEWLFGKPRKLKKL